MGAAHPVHTRDEHQSDAATPQPRLPTPHSSCPPKFPFPSPGFSPEWGAPSPGVSPWVTNLPALMCNFGGVFLYTGCAVKRWPCRVSHVGVPSPPMSSPGEAGSFVRKSSLSKHWVSFKKEAHMFFQNWIYYNCLISFSISLCEDFLYPHLSCHKEHQQYPHSSFFIFFSSENGDKL